MIYGTPAIRIETDVTDRIGIRVLVLSLLWQPSRWPMSLRELAAEAPAPPEVEGGLELIGRQNQPDGGALRTTWSYEGVDGDGKSVTFKDRSRSDDYSFAPGFAQVPIELHPDFLQLKSEFSGFDDGDGKTKWQDTLPEKSGSGFAKGNGGKSKKRNPMFGQEDFLRLEGTYSFRYASTSLAGAESGVGKIHSNGSLPGKPPKFADRDWLKAPSPYQKCGPVLEITEIYWLSGPGGWPEPIYGGKGGSANAPYTSGGLTTGGIYTGSL